MNRALLYTTLLLLCVSMTGCLGLVYVPSREVATVAPGKHETLSFKVDLPKRKHSWEIGLWPSGDSTNIIEVAGKRLRATVKNTSSEVLTLSPGGRTPFERPLPVQPGETATVHDAPIENAAQIHGLFGCDTHEHAVSFVLNLQFRPGTQVDKPMKVLARGRDAL